MKVNTGIHLASNLPKVLNSQQYGEVLWNAMRNAELTPSHTQYGSGEYPVIPDYIIPAGASERDVDLSKYNTGKINSCVQISRVLIGSKKHINGTNNYR